ncbi:hypothetical protein [Microbaculum marinum]|uniref:Asparagine synthetase domain-containing protein n=1 Tax=Microbaculum marinum TaxID=1764581 RepID=A0AAW9RQ19_9HYPH
MEFLLSNLPVDDAQAILERLNRVRITEAPLTTVSDYGPFQTYLSAAALAEGSHDLVFDGSVFVHDKLISNFRNLDGPSLRDLEDMASSRPGDTAGCFCLVSIDRDTGGFLIQFDPLNAYPCFLWRSGDRFAVSNNIHFIGALVPATGGRLTRSVLPYLADFALGSGYDAGSPYEEIDIVGPGEALRGGPDLQVVRRGIHMQDATEGASYEEALDHAAQRLRQRIEALAAAFDGQNVFFDLTGGMDSRMVLAAVVARAPRLGWDYRTMYDYPHPDGHCAALIGETFGLGRVQGIPWFERRGLSAIQQMRFETFVSMGAGAKTGTTISVPYTDTAHIHGGYGEIAGGTRNSLRFWSGTHPPTYPDLSENYLARLASIGLLRYFTPRGIAWLRSLLEARLGTYEAAGAAATDAPLHFYNLGRLRSHFGMLSRLRGQTRNYIDLLYDIHLQSCALKAAPMARMKGKVNLDLIRRVGGDAVAGLPLANEEWDAALFAKEEQRAAIRKPPITAKTPKSFQTDPVKRQIPPSTSERDTSFRPRLDPNLRKYDMTTVAAPLRDVYRRQAFLATYLPETRGAGDLETLLDWGEVDALLSAPAEALKRHPVEPFLQALCDCVIWLRNEELSVFA